MEPLPSARPPAEFAVVDTWVLDSASELRTLRAGLYRAITGRDATPGRGFTEVPERMVLVASELATNALEHGRPPTTVLLRRFDDELILEVTDHDPDSVPVLAEPRRPGRGGHGLRLTQQLADGIAWYRDVDTKHIWARFPADGACT